MSKWAVDVLFDRTKDIIREEGVRSFIRQASTFLVGLSVYPFLNRGNYYVYEKPLSGGEAVVPAAKLQLIIDNLAAAFNVTLKIIHTPEELDELRRDGYSLKAPIPKGMLERHALPFCAFVRRDFGHVTWVAFDETVRKKIDPLPFKVDFAKGEVCSGRSFTNPRYRGIGLMSYVYSHIFAYLANQGFQKSRFSVHEDNIASQKALAVFDPIITSKGRYLKILAWQSWKEKPVV